MLIHPSALIRCLLTCALVGVPTAASAQDFFGFGGLEARVGVVFPEQAKSGFGGSADFDLGYLRSPKVRTLLGFNYFSADVDRRVGGTPVGGSFSATGGRAGLRFDPFGPGRLTPYLVTAVTAHSVAANVADRGTEQLLDGFYVGAGLGAGLTYALDSGQRFRVTLEGRRVFVTNISHSAIEVGLRLMPRGPASYVDVAAERRRVAREDEARLAREREEARLSDERAQAQADSLRADRAERARQDVEAERLRSLQADSLAARLRMEREEADRLARAGQQDRDRERELERLRQEQQAAQQRQQRDEVDRLRRRADSLEAARSAEAQARGAAEADAAAARARAAAADSATRLAEGRAAEAERRRYQAVLDLDRLMTDVTEIRETERGLAIVLGQGLFASGQYQLSPKARSQIGTIGAVLAQYPDNRISVEGHTDSVGRELANQRLSEMRAEAVRAALIAERVDPARIDMAGYGQSQPVADNNTAEGRGRNRRVEIVIVGARRPAPPGGG